MRHLGNLSMKFSFNGELKLTENQPGFKPSPRARDLAARSGGCSPDPPLVNMDTMGKPDDKQPFEQLFQEEDSAVATESDLEPKEPRRYQVLLLNDDYTTMEFVVMVLMNVFHHPEPAAIEIMLHVHHQGVGVAGVYSFEVAETKVNKVHELARQHEFPLRCSMEAL
jgi:ATP-dependent Clp protease adaptor protein ClpS